MSSVFSQLASNFDQSRDQYEGLLNKLLALPAANYLTDEDRTRIKMLSQRMRIREAIAARQQPRTAATNATTRGSPLSVCRHAAINIHKPRPRRQQCGNNEYHANLMAIYGSQQSQNQNQNQKRYDQQAQAHQQYHLAMLQLEQKKHEQQQRQQQRERAFRLVVSRLMGPPSLTSSNNPMLVNAQPATALTMGLSGTLFGRPQPPQQQAGNVNFVGGYINTNDQVLEPPLDDATTSTSGSTLTDLHETNYWDDCGDDQHQEIDLSLRL